MRISDWSSDVCSSDLDWIGVEDTGGLGHRVAVEVDQRLLGRITVAASVRDDAADAVRRLAGLGIESFLVADEPSRDTDRLADAAGIPSRVGATAPETRGRLVAEPQEHGRVGAPEVGQGAWRGRGG